MNSALLPDAETTRWYEDKVRRFGYDHRGLGFRSRSSQERRFEALLGLGDFHGRTLLDVGCGFGDFLQFLEERGIRPSYTGLDICEPMIRRCRERFASAGAGERRLRKLAAQPMRLHEFMRSSVGAMRSRTPGASSPKMPLATTKSKVCGGV